MFRAGTPTDSRPSAVTWPLTQPSRSSGDEQSASSQNAETSLSVLSPTSTHYSKEHSMPVMAIARNGPSKHNRVSTERS